MKIIFFTHPDFLEHQSMPRFSRLLSEGMNKRGHSVELFSPKPRFFNISKSPFIKKWMSYIDQYILFPQKIKGKLKNSSHDTLFVFTDQALGPWIPYVAERKHVIHCHDFLAQFSALGLISENPTGWSGKLYQSYIRKGYSKGKNFISVSNKTKQDLHKLLVPDHKILSEVVYNGLNQDFKVMDPTEARISLGNKVGIDLNKGFILHVGGNQWYKNRTGVIDIYNAWRVISNKKLPLLLIGQKPSEELLKLHQGSPFKEEIHFLSGLEDKFIRQAYSGASIFLFPSLAEGFGWPIAEAMASGCLVVTTDEAPMTEVAGKAGFLIPKPSRKSFHSGNWAAESAMVVDRILRLPVSERQKAIEMGLINAKRFDPDIALDKIEDIYKRILESEQTKIEKESTARSHKALCL